MKAGRLAGVAAIVVLAVVVGWVLFVGLPRWTAPRQAKVGPATAASAATPEEPTRKIRAHLYYVASDGLRLQGADREVEFGEGTLEQARHLVEALLEPAPEPLLSPLPAGTSLRGLFVTSNGTVFVDLSAEAASGQPGGILEEELTVYSVVNTLADNLPAVTAVQVLVDGHEVDTLAGHVDLRHPLVKNAALTEAPQPAPQPAP
jgi:hypothetical protein